MYLLNRLWVVGAIVALASGLHTSLHAQDAEREEAGAEPAAPVSPPADVGIDTLQPPVQQPATVSMGEMVIARPGTFTGFYSPLTLDSVSAQDIQDYLYESTADALREVPGVMIQKTSPGQGSPFIRGQTGFRNLFLIDGVRLNNGSFRSGPIQFWTTVDPFSLQGIHVIKGPASTVFGSDAIGGVVNAITKSPTTYGEGVRGGGRVFYRVASAERSHIVRGEGQLTVDRKFGVHIGATGKDFGDLEGGHAIGRQENTGYTEWDADVKMEYHFDDLTKLVFLYQQVQQNNVPRTHSTIFAESFAGTTVGSDLQRDLSQDRRLVYLQLHAAQVNDWIDSAKFSISWHEQHDQQDRIRSSGRRDLQSRQVGSLGLFAHFQSDSPIGLLTYGFDYYHDNINAAETRREPGGPAVPRPQGPVGDQSTYDLLGLFIEDQIDVTDRLTVIVGGGFTYAAAESKQAVDPETGDVGEIEDDYLSFVGTGRALYELIPEHWNVYGGVSQGFRAPNLHDLTASIAQRTGTVARGATGLDPEEYVQFEIGTKVQHEKFAAEAVYFYTLVDDQIVDAATGEVTGDGEIIVSRINAGDGFFQGVELSASYRIFPQLTVFGTFSWTEGEVDTFLDVGDPTSKVRAPATRVQPITGRVGLRLDDANGKWWIEGLATFADKQDELSPGDEGDTQRIPPGGTPGYQVYTLRGGVRVHDQVTLTGAIENIFDEDYRVHGSGTNEPGRNFVLGAEIKF